MDNWPALEPIRAARPHGAAPPKRDLDFCERQLSPLSVIIPAYAGELGRPSSASTLVYPLLSEGTGVSERGLDWDVSLVAKYRGDHSLDRAHLVCYYLSK